MGRFNDWRRVLERYHATCILLDGVRNRGCGLKINVIVNDNVVLNL